jgi:hypothetical protein
VVAYRLSNGFHQPKWEMDVMGFYGSEPFDSAEATYVWTGLGTPGFFSVTVKGHAPNYTSGIKLVRDPEFVGGLAIQVMGWTGPLGQGTKAYTVHGSFNGSFLKEIVVIGTNKREVVKVKEIPFTNDEEFLKHVEELA